MKHYFRRIMSLLLFAAMLSALLLPAMAMDGGMPPEPPGGFGAPPGGPGGGGGAGAAGQEFATYDEVRSSAAILFEGGAVDENFEGRGFECKHFKQQVLFGITIVLFIIVNLILGMKSQPIIELIEQGLHNFM